MASPYLYTVRDKDTNEVLLEDASPNEAREFMKMPFKISNLGEGCNYKSYTFSRRLKTEEKQDCRSLLGIDLLQEWDSYVYRFRSEIGLNLDKWNEYHKQKEQEKIDEEIEKAQIDRRTKMSQ